MNTPAGNREATDPSTPQSEAGGLRIARPDSGWAAEPLETLTVLGAAGGTVSVADGKGREYFRSPAAAEVTFAVGGALGTHTVAVLDAGGEVVARAEFQVDARTKVQDEGGRFAELLGILYETMRRFGRDGVGTIDWRGRSYAYFLPWILDHVHTAKGMQYFNPSAPGLVDLFRQAQREDGMIWSFVHTQAEGIYHETAYEPYGYARCVDGVLFGRQPVENHNEANFVEGVYLGWKGGGDDAWMAANLDAAVKALDYSVTDRARWSSKFALLKRGYTIDSWDFQVDDEQTVEFPLATLQMIDPERTKFGVFFGDNTGYMLACGQLAEMLDRAGRADEAAAFRKRSEEIHQRLTALAWNGRFFTHHVTEDEGGERDLGVDEKAQIAMSNAYSLNRGIPHEQCAAILRTYRDLRDHLPAGSPGEFYAIYPPFGRGFGKASPRWQYMNGGVHGHAAGELARGAFEHGFEQYGADILLRMAALGRKHDGVVRFAYTGAVDPPPPPQAFTPIDVSTQANMDLRDAGGPGAAGWMGGDPDNDMRGLPVGRQEFAGVPYDVADPSHTGRRGAIAVSHRGSFPRSVAVPVGATAGAVYLLHTAGAVGASGLAGAVTLRYEDGSEHTRYILEGRDLCGWWFPELESDHSGVAWRGPNPRSKEVGVCWAVIENPCPDKAIRDIAFTAALDGATYAVMGVTLADRMPHVPAKAVSYGGPDNWAGGTCMFALMAGLAGIVDADTVYRRVRLSPRWAATDVPSATVTARYAASEGYVAYRYRHDEQTGAIELTVTGSGEQAELRVLLPAGAKAVAAATVNGEPAEATIETVENSLYAALPTPLPAPTTIRITYTR